MKITKSQLKQIIKEEITDILNEEGTAPTAVGLPNDIGTPEKLLAGLRALDIEKTDHNQANVIVNFINKSLQKNPSEDVGDALRDYKEKIADKHNFTNTKSRRDAHRDKAAQTDRPQMSSERDYQMNPFGIQRENLQEAYTQKRFDRRNPHNPMKKPGSYYYQLKTSSDNPKFDYGGDDTRPEEIKAINQIANRMYNLELMISQTKKMPELIKQVQQDIQQAGSMDGRAAEEAQIAQKVLQSLLQAMPQF